MADLAPNGTLIRRFVQDGLTISEVEFYPDEGFPLCLGYMVGEDDGRSPLYPTPAAAIARHTLPPLPPSVENTDA